MIKTLRKIGNSTGLVLDKATLEAVGLSEGDEVHVTVTSSSIVLMPAHRVAGAEQFEAAAERVMTKRKDLLRRLA